MTLEQIYYIAEITAVIGILISLVLVLIQLRQTRAELRENHRATKLGIEVGITGSIYETYKTLTEDKELRELVLKARSDYKNMTFDEKSQFSAYLFMVIAPAIPCYTAYQEGAALENTLRYHAASASRALNCEAGQDWVMRQGHMFDPAFRKFIEGLSGLGPVMAPGFPEECPLPTRRDAGGDAA